VTLAEVDVLLDEPVGRGDLLEVRPTDDPSQFLTTNADRDAVAGETITCRTARPMEPGCPVRVIRSQQALDEAARVARSDVPRTRDVRVRVRALLGRPLAIELACVDGSARALAEGGVVEAARTRAVTRQDLIDHAGRLGGSAFRAASFEVELDEGVGLRFSDVHRVRSEACRRLAAQILGSYASREADKVPSAVRLERDVRRRLSGMAEENASDGVEVCALVRDGHAARVARNAGASRIYATADALSEGFAEDEVVPWLDEVCREPDHARLDPWVHPGCPVAVGNVSQLSLANSLGAKAEVRPCIPVHNASALAALVSSGAAGIWLTPELSLPEVLALSQVSPVPVGLMVYGRPRVMTSEHCVLQAARRCKGDCASCELRGDRVELVGDKGERFPVRTDLQGRSRIYAAQPLDAAPEVGELVAGGVLRLMVDGTLLSDDELADAVGRVAAAVTAAREGRPMPKRRAGHTSGHLHKPID
jgi:putative protease